MGFYPNSETLCDVMSELFRRTLATPAAVKMLQHGGMVVRLMLSDPQLTLTVDGKRQLPEFTCQPDDARRADLTLQMPTDVLHRIWLNELRLRDAFFGGQIKLDGPMLRALKLSELFRQVEQVYPQVLRDKGLL